MSLGQADCGSGVSRRHRNPCACSDPTKIARIMLADVSPLHPRVAVVTVSYRSDDVMPLFLASVDGASSNPNLVVVVDNLAAEGSSIRAMAETKGATYLPLASNVGYGGAINAGVRELPATVEWVLISNPDVELGSGVIDTLVRTASEDLSIASVGPTILNENGSIYASARAVPSLRTGIGHALFANLWTTNPWSAAYRKTAQSHETKRDAGWLSGSCLLVRRSAFEKLGGFDENYFMYFEDVDLGYRFGKHGYRNVFDPAGSATHTGAHSTTNESGRMIQAHHDSARRFLMNKYRGPILWPVRAVVTAGLNIRSWLLRRKLNH